MLMHVHYLCIYCISSPIHPRNIHKNKIRYRSIHYLVLLQDIIHWITALDNKKAGEKRIATINNWVVHVNQSQQGYV